MPFKPIPIKKEEFIKSRQYSLMESLKERGVLSHFEVNNDGQIIYQISNEIIQEVSKIVRAYFHKKYYPELDVKSEEFNELLNVLVKLGTGGIWIA
jgi:hypothetical protein